MLESEKKQKVVECRSSGKSVKVWCKEKGIPYSTYMGWSKKFFSEEAGILSQNKETTMNWMPIKQHKEENVQVKQEKQKTSIELRCGKWVIAIVENYDQEFLKAVLSLVNDLCC